MNKTARVPWLFAAAVIGEFLLAEVQASLSVVILVYILGVIVFCIILGV